MTDEQDAVINELAKMLATVYEATGDETPRLLVFDNTLIPNLRAGEVIEVKMRRTHKSGNLFPLWDMAGVIGYVAP